MIGNKLSNKDWIYLVFFLSGASALIYETVWLRILIRVLGNTVYATSIILAVFMAGLALGSYFVHRLIGKDQSLLRVYSYLELGVGLSATVLLLILPQITPLYRFLYHLSGDNRLFLTLSQSLIMFALLLIPTFLMGGTLPLLSSHTKRYESSLTDRLGALYGFNTLGAVVGVIGSGLILIGAIGETKTILLGAALNLFAACVAYSLSRTGIEAEAPAAEIPGRAPATDIPPYGNSAEKIMLILYGLSGFAAIAYEIIWTRIFQVYVGTSIYAFTMMLAFYLIGLALGSLWGSKTLDRVNNPLLWVGLAQEGIAFYGLAGLYLLAFAIRPFPDQLNLGSLAVIPLLVVTPITFLLGLIFPIMIKSYVKNEVEVPRSIGLLYALNLIGCILGSLFCGFVFIVAFGTRGTILLLSGLNILLGLIALIFSRSLSNIGSRLLVGGLIIITLILGFFSPDPYLTIINERITKSRSNAKMPDSNNFFYNKESAAATTTAFGQINDPLNDALWVNGQGMTALVIEPKLMAHLPLLMHPNPKNILVICFGMGTTLRSAWAYKGLRCDTVELVPEIYDCFKYFHRNGPQILADPRVRHFVGDGRNFLLMNPYSYDVITLDPPPPIFSARTVNLYSQEFIRLCRQHLNPGGIMCLWIPPAEYSEVRSIMKTFQSVFPNTYVWRGPKYRGFFLTGLKDDRAALDLEHFDREDRDPAILADLNEWDKVPSIALLKRLLITTPQNLDRFLAGAPLITDDLPYLEFPLWRSLFDRSYRLILNSGEKY